MEQMSMKVTLLCYSYDDSCDSYTKVLENIMLD